MINLKQFQENNDYRNIQKMFCNISLKSYFDYLFTLTGNEDFLNMYSELVVYSNPNEKFQFDLSLDTDTYNENIPIGDMLLMGINMIYNTSNYYSEELFPRAEYIGWKILNYIIILPLMSL